MQKIFDIYKKIELENMLKQNFSISKIAKELNISRVSVYRELRKGTDKNTDGMRKYREYTAKRAVEMEYSYAKRNEKRNKDN